MEQANDSGRWWVYGRFDRERVLSTRVASTRQEVPEVSRAIERAWDAARSVPGVNLFDGPVARLEAWRVEHETLQIDLSITSYRIVVGTNFHNPDFARTHGPEVMANPIGVSTGVISRDGRLLLGLRSSAVAYYPNRIHPFAGSLEVASDIDFFDNALRELREELCIDSSLVTSITCCGLYEDLHMRHADAIFLATISLDASELADRLDRVEHSEIVQVGPDDSELEDEQLTPFARAAVEAWRDTRFLKARR